MGGSRGFTTASVVEQWLGVFPCNFFGFTQLVQSFSKAQLAGLRSVPADRVLLETDVPYFQFPGHRHSFPGFIGMCAGVVALALGVSWESLLERSVANARALYDGGD